MPACTPLHMYVHIDGGTRRRDAEKQRRENRNRPEVRGEEKEGREGRKGGKKEEEEEKLFFSLGLRVASYYARRTQHPAPFRNSPGLPPPSLPPSLRSRSLPVPAAPWSTSCGWKSKLRSISPDDTERGKVPLPLPSPLPPWPSSPPHRWNMIAAAAARARARALILDVA